VISKSSEYDFPNVSKSILDEASPKNIISVLGASSAGGNLNIATPERAALALSWVLRLSLRTFICELIAI
jgi:hypothetical protein